MIHRAILVTSLLLAWPANAYSPDDRPLPWEIESIVLTLDGHLGRDFVDAMFFIAESSDLPNEVRVRAVEEIYRIGSPDHYSYIKCSLYRLAETMSYEDRAIRSAALLAYWKIRLHEQQGLQFEIDLLHDIVVGKDQNTQSAKTWAVEELCSRGAIEHLDHVVASTLASYGSKTAVRVVRYCKARMYIEQSSDDAKDRIILGLNDSEFYFLGTDLDLLHQWVLGKYANCRDRVLAAVLVLHGLKHQSQDTSHGRKTASLVTKKLLSCGWTNEELMNRGFLDSTLMDARWR